MSNNLVKIEYTADQSNQVVQYTGDDWNTFKKEIFPSARNDDTIKLALQYCLANKLDPMRKPVSIIGFNSKDGYKEQIVFTIGSYRTVAARSGWAGNDEVQWGEEIQSSGKKCYEWGRLTVYKFVGGQRIPFVGPKVFFNEVASPRNPMWNSRPITMHEKCVEAAALRRAFPEEFNDWYVEEEMQKTTMPAVNVDKSGIEALMQEAGVEPEPYDDAIIAEVVVESSAEPEADSLQDMISGFYECKTIEDLVAVRDSIKSNFKLPPDQLEVLKQEFSKAQKKIKGE